MHHGPRPGQTQRNDAHILLRLFPAFHYRGQHSPGRALPHTAPRPATGRASALRNRITAGEHAVSRGPVTGSPATVLAAAGKEDTPARGRVFLGTFLVRLSEV